MNTPGAKMNRSFHSSALIKRQPFEMINRLRLGYALSSRRYSMRNGFKIR
jgi:hypothetical protein